MIFHSKMTLHEQREGESEEAGDTMKLKLNNFRKKKRPRAMTVRYEKEER